MECCYKRIDDFSLLLGPLVEACVLVHVYWVPLFDKMLGEELVQSSSLSPKLAKISCALSPIAKINVLT